MAGNGTHGLTAFREWLWREPAAGEGPAPRFLRAALRITLVYWHEFWRDAILLRASALAFTVILSIVPVLALSTAVLKGLGAGNEMRKAAYQFVETLAAKTDEKLPASQKKKPATKAEKQVNQTFASHLRRAVDAIFNYVDRTNFATLGIVGLIFLFITVIMVLAAIEDSMNVVWNAPSGRPIGRKVMDFLALMLLLPLAVNLGMAAQSQETARLVERFFPMPWAGPLIVHLLTLGLLVAILTLFYQFLPNTRVDFRPALIGGILGTLGWLLIQAIYIRLQVGVARYNAIYGSFATLPLFLLWVYSSWVVFLSGAEFAYAASVWRHYVPHRQMTPALRLALAYDLLAAVYHDFGKRHLTDPALLSHRIGCTDIEAEQIVRELMTAGYLREAEDPGGGLMPAACDDRVRAAEVMDAVWGMASRPSPGGRLAANMLAGAKSVLTGRSLEELFGDKENDQSP